MCGCVLLVFILELLFVGQFCLRVRLLWYYVWLGLYLWFVLFVLVFADFGRDYDLFVWCV